MKIALYHAYSSMRNFGDWWLFEIIKKELSPISVIPLSRVVRRYGVRRMMYKAWKHHLLPSPPISLIGGGTVLLPCSDDFFVPMMNTSGKKYTVGSGAKSTEECERWKLVSHSRAEQLCELYSRIDCVSVRGPISKQSLEVLGVKNKIQIVGDPFLSLFDPATTIKPHQKLVLFNPANLSDTQGHYWCPSNVSEEDIYDAIVTDLKKRGCRIQVFCCGPEDERISERVAQRHSLGEVHQVASPSDMDRVLVPGAAVIATRLHAMIYSIIQGIPTAALIYQDKHLDFLHSVGLGGGVRRLSELNPDNIMEQCDQMWERNTTQWPITHSRITDLNCVREQLYSLIKQG